MKKSVVLYVNGGVSMNGSRLFVLRLRDLEPGFWHHNGSKGYRYILLFVAWVCILNEF